MKCILFPCLALIFIGTACNSKGDEPGNKNKGDTALTKKTISRPEVPVKKPPIINITDTISTKRIVVCMRDSAANYERISGKLAQIYGVKLNEVFKKNKLRSAGAPMAWYKNKKAPYFFEAGIPVTKKPLKLPKGVFIKETTVDSIVLAHFYGPYDLIPQGYDAVKEWMKDNKRSFGGAPYEIYMTDPIDKKGKPVDPYKVQTDIIFPRR